MVTFLGVYFTRLCFKLNNLAGREFGMSELKLSWPVTLTADPPAVISRPVLLGAFYYTLGNIRPLYRSSLKAIQLLCLCKSAMIKKYGIDEVLQPFIVDLQKLEQVLARHLFFCPYSIGYILWTPCDYNG
jgi:hypothetical protein